MSPYPCTIPPIKNFAKYLFRKGVWGSPGNVSGSASDLVALFLVLDFLADEAASLGGLRPRLRDRPVGGVVLQGGVLQNGPVEDDAERTEAPCQRADAVEHVEVLLAVVDKGVRCIGHRDGGNRGRRADVAAQRARSTRQQRSGPFLPRFRSRGEERRRVRKTLE